MKQNLKTLGLISISALGIILLFIIIVGIGNYLQAHNMKVIGNIFMLLFPICVFFAVKIFNSKVNKLPMDKYGFQFRGFFKNFFIGSFIALIITAVSILIAALFWGAKVDFVPIKADIGKHLLGLVFTTILVGVWEEFFFRGLVFNTLLKNNFNFNNSAFISAILFSVIHWSSFDMKETSWFWYFGIVFIGYILVYMYTYANSILIVISFHFIWNFLSFSIGSPTDNKIGIIEISNYTDVSKTIDNIFVCILGIIFLGILLIKKPQNSLRIKKYIEQIKN